MRSLERGKAAPRGLVPEARRITDVAAVNDHVAEIRFGKSDFLLIPAPIDSRSAQRWVSCMRRIDAIKFQFSEDGLSARLNGVGVSGGQPERCLLRLHSGYSTEAFLDG